MILSVSRRTDIPAFYGGWFFKRLQAGFVYVKNPMNPRQISRIDLSPEVVDCIVFWTKNPEPMLKYLDELSGYPFYFQFTLTGYGTDIEPGLGGQKEHLLSVFASLAQKIGRERVIWRYDPIIFTPKYTEAYHLYEFEKIAKALYGYTDKCVISFVDMYAKIKKNVRRLEFASPDPGRIAAFAGKLREIAESFRMEMASCAERIDLEKWGIAHNSCIDKALIEKLIGGNITAKKDKNQRGACQCVESIDIGGYNTCPHGCKYCYANFSEESVLKNCKKYDPDGPLLCNAVAAGDKVTQRKVWSLKENQWNI